MGGVRWQLGEWGYPKNCYTFEEDDWSFHASGKEIFQVNLKSGQLEITWKSDEWKNWSDLQNSQEFKDLIKSANDTWVKAVSKGKAKEKNKTKTK